MPMPPPRPSTDPRHDRQSAHEMSQIVRALHDRGPLDPVELTSAVGATYWDTGHFDRALTMARVDGYVTVLEDGRLAAV